MKYDLMMVKKPENGHIVSTTSKKHYPTDIKQHNNSMNKLLFSGIILE
jgi:hypothetical protein